MKNEKQDVNEEKVMAIEAEEVYENEDLKEEKKSESVAKKPWYKRIPWKGIGAGVVAAGGFIAGVTMQKAWGKPKYTLKLSMAENEFDDLRDGVGEPADDLTSDFVDENPEFDAERFKTSDEDAE